jgi:signal recognition particle receptor subunit beta
MANLAEWAHMLMNPSLLGLIVGALLVLSVPLFLHLLIFKSGQLTSLPSILVIGPSGSGKTALATLVSTP